MASPAIPTPAPLANVLADLAAFLVPYALDANGNSLFGTSANIYSGTKLTFRVVMSGVLDTPNARLFLHTPNPAVAPVPPTVLLSMKNPVQDYPAQGDAPIIIGDVAIPTDVVIVATWTSAWRSTSQAVTLHVIPRP